MSIHYQAFIRFLESRGATESQLIEELHHAGRTVADYSSYLDTLIANNEQFHFTYYSPASFTFRRSLYGNDFWYNVFYPEDIPTYTPIRDVLAPFYEQPLTIEQIAVIFLKHHRKFTHFKSAVTVRPDIFTTLWHVDSFGAILEHICRYPPIYRTRWNSLIDHFNLRHKTFDLNTILSIR